MLLAFLIHSTHPSCSVFIANLCFSHSEWSHRKSIALCEVRLWACTWLLLSLLAAKIGEGDIVTLNPLIHILIVLPCFSFLNSASQKYQCDNA